MKKKEANPQWWKEGVRPDYPYEYYHYTDPNEAIPVEDILAEFDEMLAIQCTDGNWNFDPYLHGMANGMLFMKSIIDGKDPPYLEAPDVWLADLPDDGLPPTVADECYTDELGNQMCEGPPHTEDPSMGLVPFDVATQQEDAQQDDNDDKVYFTAEGAARPRGLNFNYPKADEPWRPPRKKGKNLYYPDPRRESERLPFKKEKRKEDHPTLVETCGRNYILPECREEWEEGFNAIANAFQPFVRLAVVPHEELEEASWTVVDSHSDPMSDVKFYGTGPYEVRQERKYFAGWEGEGTIEVVIGSGITYNIDLDWKIEPNAKGPKDIELRVWVKGGPEDLKLEMRDGSVLTAKEYFTMYVPSLIWEYDLAAELFPPPGEPEYEDPRIPAM